MKTTQQFEFNETETQGVLDKEEKQEHGITRIRINRPAHDQRFLLSKKQILLPPKTIFETCQFEFNETETQGVYF